MKKFELPNWFYKILFEVFIPDNFNVFYFAMFLAFVGSIGGYFLVSRRVIPELSLLGGYAGGYVLGMLSAVLFLAIYNFIARGIPAIRAKMNRNNEK